MSFFANRNDQGGWLEVNSMRTGYFYGSNELNACKESISSHRIVWESRDSTLPPPNQTGETMSSMLTNRRT